MRGILRGLESGAAVVCAGTGCDQVLPFGGLGRSGAWRCEAITLHMPRADFDELNAGFPDEYDKLFRNAAEAFGGEVNTADVALVGVAPCQFVGPRPRPRGHRTRHHERGCEQRPTVLRGGCPAEARCLGQSAERAGAPGFGLGRCPLLSALIFEMLIRSFRGDAPDPFWNTPHRSFCPYRRQKHGAPNFGPSIAGPCHQLPTTQKCPQTPKFAPGRRTCSTSAAGTWLPRITGTPELATMRRGARASSRCGRTCNMC